MGSFVSLPPNFLFSLHIFATFHSHPHDPFSVLSFNACAVFQNTATARKENLLVSSFQISNFQNPINTYIKNIYIYIPTYVELQCHIQ